ncbi:beta-N-acetylhexosaminidase [Lacticaseibacillus hegangensis]|uniref:Beta-N-acetylhexosaminidase n=1 Tax=Lacticaseibacillus hegangensis TaxID=2486010 RepID=A0ABW4CVC2_9LACO|nr:beta-N-acetylhexosaminidase [Lacticaseibacillus hegangensis]
MTETIAQEAGELFIVGFHGSKPSAEVREMIREYHVSGIILFARNIESAGQLAALTDALQTEARQAGYTEPLLIALDQENGVIRRIEAGVSLLPGAMALAATGDPENAARSYAASAKELSELGVNWSLAPDADVNTNPDNPVIGVRSFGDNAQLVSQYVVQAMNGLQQNGIAACLKHFPGHGNTSVDSHQDLPVLTQSLEDLQGTELVPFEAGIKNGVNSVMIAHIQFPAVDRLLPASLSPVVISTLLRKRLAFNGVIVTDDLEMKAIADHYGTPAACVQALKSGADLAMVSHVYETQKESIARVVAAINEGELVEADVAEKINRLRALRRRVGRWQNHFDAEKFSILVNNDNQLANELYQHSVTVVQSPTQIIGPAPLVVTFDHQRYSLVVEHQKGDSALFRAILEYYPEASKLSVDLTTATPLAELSEMKDQRPVIVGTSNVTGFNDIQAQAVKMLIDRGHPVHVVAMRNPYDCRWFPALASYIVAYEPTPQAMHWAASALAKKGNPSGRLPVVLP